MDLLSQSPMMVAPFKHPFIKMHGLRNYFVIFDRRNVSLELDAADIVRICDVHVGVGGEQVLIIEPPSSQASTLGAYAAFRIFNVDGREVGACGNATRCIAYLLLEESARLELFLETAGGLLHCQRQEGMQVSVTMGPIKTEWASIPLAYDANTLHLPIESGPLRDGMALYIGNPHAVFFVADLDVIDVANFAPKIQNHPLFPEGINVGVAQVIDDSTLRLKVWERPGILTQACGTGACVAAYAGRSRGLLKSDHVTVRLAAGDLRIKLHPNQMVIMTGPVDFCCFGYV